VSLAALRSDDMPIHPEAPHHPPYRTRPRLEGHCLVRSVVHVSRIRECKVLDVKFVLLANNVAIGAATKLSNIMNAEVALAVTNI
jgi:aspartate-semialdehyde dehydrogenase